MTGKKNNRVLILAGEPSGDVHGADLIRAMKQLDSSLIVHGIGGHCMAAAGVRLFFPLIGLSAMGLWEVIQQIRPVKQAFDLFRHHLRSLDPGLVILVDYPGFNLRAAKHVKNTPGHRCFTYIPPRCGPGTRPVSNR